MPFSREVLPPDSRVFPRAIHGSGKNTGFPPISGKEKSKIAQKIACDFLSDHGFVFAPKGQRQIQDFFFLDLSGHRSKIGARRDPSSPPIPKDFIPSAPQGQRKKTRESEGTRRLPSKSLAIFDGRRGFFFPKEKRRTFFYSRPAARIS